jgi:hypothetical protein
MGGMIHIPLEGGGGRKRQDILLPGFTVNCQWLLSATEYTEFMGFFVSTLRYGRDDFLMDLITDVGIPTTHLCRTVGGIPKLTQQKGDGYWVQCAVECDKNPTFTSTITYTVTEEENWAFDGVDDEVNLGDVIDFNRTDTKSMFFWYRTTTSDRCGIGKQVSANQQGFRFVVKSSTGSGSNQDLILAGPSATQQIQVGCTPRPPMDGQLHHFGFTYSGNSNGSGFKFYIDGVLCTTNIGTNNLTSASTANSEALKIGRRGTSLTFDGTLEHVSIWDIELSQFQVNEIYDPDEFPDLSLVSMAANLQLWLKIDTTDSDDPSGVIDHSGNGFHGTANNGLGAASGIADGQVIFPGIARFFKTGDLLQIINSSGIHPDGDVPLNLDGVYQVSDQAGGNAVVLATPAAVNDNWTTLYNIDPVLLAEYGGPGTGDVTSTVTKVPT